MTVRLMVLLTLALSVLLSGSRSQTTVNVNGIGSTFAANVYLRWISAYKATRGSVDLKMTYDPEGSGAGKAAMETAPGAEQTMAYGASDMPLSMAEFNTYPDLQTLPTMAGPVVLTYNLPGVKNLTLSREQIVGIYNGTFFNWNHSTFRTTNPQTRFPSAAIIPVARAENSGTTFMFTSALSSFSSAWNNVYGTFQYGLNSNDTPINWNKDVVTVFARRESGVADAVQQLPYSIGYTSIYAAAINSLPYAKLINRAGYPVLPLRTNVRAAMDDFANQMTAHLAISMVDAPSNASYPLSGYTYMIIRMTGMQDCSAATELLRFIRYFSNSEDAANDADEMGMIALSDAVRQRVEAAVLTKFQCGGQLVDDLLRAQLEKEAAAIASVTSSSWQTPVEIAVPLSIVALFVVGVLVVYQKIRYDKLLSRNDWDIKEDQVSIEVRKGQRPFDRWKNVNALAVSSSMDGISQSVRNGATTLPMVDLYAKWNGYEVALRKANFLLEPNQTLIKPVIRTLISLKDISHENVAAFYGLSTINNSRYVVTEFCAKGSLASILQDSHYSLNDTVKYSFTEDIVSGMNFLHLKGVIHGYLTSDVCLVDKRWSVKISQWDEYHLLRAFLQHNNLAAKNTVSPMYDPQAVTPERNGPAVDKSGDMHFQYFWYAPEKLFNETIVSKSMDVYSFGILLYEIFSRHNPYENLFPDWSVSDILNAIKDKCLRPSEGLDLIPAKVKKVMELAWSSDEGSRPTFDVLYKIFHQMRGAMKGGAIDSVLDELDAYSRNMADLLAKKQLEIDMLRQQLSSYQQQQMVTEDGAFDEIV